MLRTSVSETIIKTAPTAKASMNAARVVTTSVQGTRPSSERRPGPGAWSGGGASAGASNHGVRVVGLVTSSGGAVSVTGTAGGTGDRTGKVDAVDDAVVTSGSSQVNRSGRARQTRPPKPKKVRIWDEEDE